MKLSKRYLRSIRSNLSFYISATALTILTLLLFFIMNIAGKAIDRFGDEFFERNCLEDANFTTYLDIPSDEMEVLEEKYSLTLDKQYYTNIETDGTTARVFKATDKLNLYEITVGSDLSSDDEIIISEGYAAEQELSVGDSVKIRDKEYTVAGLFQRPDYLYMLQNESDAYKNATTFFLAYVTDAEYERIGSDSCTYFVKYTKDNHKAFRTEINDTYYMRSYLTKEENMRIDMVPMQADMFIVMSYIVLVVMPLIVVVLVSVVISRKVKSEQRMIGTLSAMGYTKGKIMLHYAGFAVIPGVLGGIISVVLTAIFCQPFGELCLADYEPLRIDCRLEVLPVILGIIIPTVMYVLSAVGAVARLLKKNTVLLLSSNTEQGRLKRVMVKNKLSFRLKFAVRSLIGNPSRSFVMLLGVVVGGFVSLLGYCLLDTMENSKETISQSLGGYEYQYVMGSLIEDNSYGGEGVIMSGVETKDGDSLNLIGTTDSNPYLSLMTTDGEKISLDDGGYYITSVVAMLNDIEKGDSMVLVNPLTLDEFEITVSEIIDYDMQSAVFTSEENACGILGIGQGLSNVIMSDKELSIPEGELLQTIKMSDSEEQFDNMTGQMGVMIYLLIGIGCAICVAAVYIAVNMLVTENRSNISMLKVLGYDDKRINKIVLRVNHILVPIGFVICIPLVYKSTDWFMIYLADYVGMYLSAYISPLSFILTLGLICLSYFCSLFFLRRKIAKVNMVESLKDNRE